MTTIKYTLNMRKMCSYELIIGYFHPIKRTYWSRTSRSNTIELCRRELKTYQYLYDSNRSGWIDNFDQSARIPRTMMIDMVRYYANKLERLINGS